jgi:hypothetical protein
MQWGAVERAPKKYDFSAYRQVCEMLQRYDLKLQVSVHAMCVFQLHRDPDDPPAPEARKANLHLPQ